MPTVIDSLLVRLGFSVNPEGLQSFAKNLGQVKHMAQAVFGFEVVKRIGAFVESSVEAAAQVQDMAEAYDLSAVKLAAMGRVAVANSVSMGEMTEAYAGVSRMAGMAALGVGRGAKLFKAFGLEAKDSTGKAKSGIEVLGDVADKLAKVSSTERLAIAGRLGISPLLAKKLAEMGRAGFMKAVGAEEGKGVLNERDYETADATAIAFTQLHGTVRNFVTLVAIQLGPTVQKLNKEFREWMSANRALIAQKTREFFVRVRDVLGIVVDVVKELAKHGTALKIVLGLVLAHKFGEKVAGWLGPLGKFVASLRKGATTAELLALGIAGIKTVLMGGILGAIALLVEDLWVFHRGGVSVTGWLLDKFAPAVEVVEGAIVALSAAFLGITASSGPLALLVVGIGGLVIAGKNLRENWDPIVQWWEDLWDRMEDAVANWYNRLPWPVRAALGIASLGTVGDFTGEKMATSSGIRASGRKVSEWAGNQPKSLESKDWKKWNGEDEEAPSWLRKTAKAAVAMTVPAALSMPKGDMLSWGRPAGDVVSNQQFSFGDFHFNVAGNLESPEQARKITKRIISEIKQQTRREQLARQHARDAQTGHR